MIICILGRQPKIGLAELEALFGNKVRTCGPAAAILDIEPNHLNHKILGGTIKIAQVIETLDTNDFNKIIDFCQKYLLKLELELPEGKIKLGLSSYGLNVKPQQLQRAGLEIKKTVRAQKRSIRIVPSSQPALNSAQVLHNNLDSGLGIELCFVADKNQVHMARTISVQDIDDYAKRDFGRPKRDPFVGMLPPKLAQTMINLSNPEQDIMLLDPFCGTGVVLMEAVLRGLRVQGTDLNPRMIEFTKANLEWLAHTYKIEVKSTDLEVADAQTHKWQGPIGAVVCETYLGQPLSGLPKPEKIREIVANCNKIISNFLKNLHAQLARDTQICIAVPTWSVNGRFIKLPLLDYLKKIGYNEVSFKLASRDDLIYHRADQIVARQLLVLKRN